MASAAAAVADGARVIEQGIAPCWKWPVSPMWAAVRNKHLDIVVFLLAHGVDPNSCRDDDRSGLTFVGLAAGISSPEVLQLLIDAGGDVNKGLERSNPLCGTLCSKYADEGNVRVLLAEPSLDLARATWIGKAPERYAPEWLKPGAGDMIAMEVWHGRGVVNAMS